VLSQVCCADFGAALVHVGQVFFHVLPNQLLVKLEQMHDLLGLRNHEMRVQSTGKFHRTRIAYRSLHAATGKIKPRFDKVI
jgi:hypothetical protein